MDCARRAESGTDINTHARLGSARPLTGHSHTDAVHSFSHGANVRVRVFVLLSLGLFSRKIIIFEILFAKSG